MQQVIDKLKIYANKIDLNNRFDYNFDISDFIFNPTEIEFLSSEKNPFDQNVQLKWILKKKFVHFKFKNSNEIF